MTAVAGLVPCAESGIKNFLRGLPLLFEIGANQRSPVNSPCAPAAGCSVIGIHARDFEQAVLQQLNNFQAALRQLLRLIGMSVAMPSRRATNSFTRGLYFMVQEPSGYMPRSMA